MTVSLAVALVAGGLSVLNPCGFPLLPAFLAYYVGAGDEALPPAPNRIAQGLVVGLTVTVGFLGVFAALALPVVFGVRLVARAVPWAGIAIGVVLTVTGLAAVLGRRVSLPISRPLAAGRGRGLANMVLFGAGYGLASVGCTLPLFLALVGAGVGAGAAGSVTAFAAYGAGIALVLTALSVSAALVQQGLSSRLRQVAGHLPRVAGVLLCVSGAYLTYYWARLLFGPRATLSSDPLVGPVTRFTARVQVLASESSGTALAVAVLVVALALAVALRQGRRA